MASDEAALAALMRASTVITAVVVRSLNSVTPRLSVVQLRVLVLVSGLGSANVNAVAEGLGTNASNASRACDRLVRAGLLTRQQSEDDRRNVVLRPSQAGQALIDSVMQHRCTELERIASRLSERQQAELRRSLTAFAAAADDVDAGADELVDQHLLSWMA
ncbi:MarR family winged helix-turn-helix transcriptional regulator [Nocardioides marmoribigeumensis]|jgi:DNA-binding MarR family transcriptional regulator|uniref:DNA-binding MarR family transcriptional regulator n=1 Tax=Nocardioides marmoribigeumensis TaxID=433649 RepID=A0ABU2BXS8_9ACTN|nr:MarR family transcriptional regulator [Nocardioides marmoribigeumensis]MDR7363197.1 DNA-binding MarR family transcriptional regulator [Nocardioides marmoribigeumensis]